ncbi:MAG: trimethylamine methyltransferase family protein, partial [Atribacterota bacterium]|nr:trimethylamine methyltransferase family protein [Atribacterota bacterium]
QKGLDILKEATSLGLPVMIGPMAQSGSTAPVTLAGALVQENAEILAGIVLTQILHPGTPICYGGIPHVTDPRTGSISFGSPEEALLSMAMVEIGASLYGFPVYVNVGLTDSLSFDSQNGWEKGITLILGMLWGATTFGHMGIIGCDQGGSIEQLILDDELISFCKRITRGIEVDEETLALEEIAVGIHEGTFLALPHTVRHFRQELWLPELSRRGTFREGRESLFERAEEKKKHLLSLPIPMLSEKEQDELERYFEKIRE